MLRCVLLVVLRFVVRYLMSVVFGVVRWFVILRLWVVVPCLFVVRCLLSVVVFRFFVGCI